MPAPTCTLPQPFVLPGDGTCMEGARIEFFGEESLQDAMILVAFPTTGLVASIAGQFLLEHLQLPLVGSVHIDGMTPVAVVTDGLASLPIRIHGGEVECKLEDRHCPRIYLVVTEIQMGDAAFDLIGRAILEWAREGGANIILCLEGVVRDEGDKEPDVFAAGGDPAALQELLAIDVPPLERAILGGVCAVILTSARKEKVCAGALVVEADPANPDGRAAVELIKALDRLIPSVTVDTKPLEEEAQRLEETVRKAERDARAQAPAHVTSGAFI